MKYILLFFPNCESCSQISEMPRNHVSRRFYWQTDETQVAPGYGKAQPTKKCVAEISFLFFFFWQRASKLAKSLSVVAILVNILKDLNQRPKKLKQKCSPGEDLSARLIIEGEGVGSGREKSWRSQKLHFSGIKKAKWIKILRCSPQKMWFAFEWNHTWWHRNTFGMHKFFWCKNRK